MSNNALVWLYFAYASLIGVAGNWLSALLSLANAFLAYSFYKGTTDETPGMGMAPGLQAASAVAISVPLAIISTVVVIAVR